MLFTLGSERSNIEDFATRLRRIKEIIEGAAGRSGRSLSDVTLVAVTKTIPAERVREAAKCGQHVFGENRVQEGLAKLTQLQDLEPRPRWHLIGHLQRNKAKSAADAFDMIQSVDSLQLAERLNGFTVGRRLPILLEVNVSQEETKSGFSIAQLTADLPRAVALEHLEVRGFMTIAPQASDSEQVRWVFRRLRQLRDEWSERLPENRITELSMGMSGDFEVAVEEGATIVRVGTALFGDRTA